MSADVTRDELAAALAGTGIIVGETRLLNIAGVDMFLATVRYPGAVAEELLAHIAAGRQKPNPGSDAALSMGCRCPQVENGYGHLAMLGVYDDWLITDGCPVHAPRAA